MMGQDDDCACPHLKLGGEILEARNWNPDCATHGTKSAWWNSPEQQAKRAATNERLRGLQEQARQARRRAVASLEPERRADT